MTTIDSFQNKFIADVRGDCSEAMRGYSQSRSQTTDNAVKRIGAEVRALDKIIEYTARLEDVLNRLGHAHGEYSNDTRTVTEDFLSGVSVFHGDTVEDEEELEKIVARYTVDGKTRGVTEAVSLAGNSTGAGHPVHHEHHSQQKKNQDKLKTFYLEQCDEIMTSLNEIGTLPRTHVGGASFYNPAIQVHTSADFFTSNLLSDKVSFPRMEEPETTTSSASPSSSSSATTSTASFAPAGGGGGGGAPVSFSGGSFAAAAPRVGGGMPNLGGSFTGMGGPSGRPGGRGQVTGETAVPAEGTFTSGYGPRWGTMHNGIDIAAPIGTPIYAVMGGTVIDSGPASGYGNWIRIQHDDGSISVYGHMPANMLYVGVGDRVEAGQNIAGMGSEGQSTGSHLHFEIWPDGANAVDPVPWLADRGITLQ